MEGWRLVEKELKKFTVADLLGKVSGLDIFPSDVAVGLGDLKRKELIIEKYIEALQNSPVESKDAFAHLNLFYRFLHSARTVWTIYELVNYVVDQEELSSDPKLLQTELNAQLNQASTKASIAVQLHTGRYWFRIELIERVGRRRNENNIISTFFCVCNINPDNIALAGVKAVHLSRVLEALGHVLNFESAKVTGLKDRCLDGIFKLFDEKRKPRVYLHRCDAVKVKPALDDRIRDLQKQQKSDRNKYIESKLGVDDIPVVKKLTYEFHTPLCIEDKSPPEAMPKEKLIKCRITFEGKDVIRGLQNSVKCGLTESTLPDYIADLRSSGKTNFLVSSRKNTKS